MTYSIGDKVRLRLVKENHKNSLKNCGMIVSGVITKAYPEHRWYQAEFQIGKATIREAFKPDDMQLIAYSAGA